MKIECICEAGFLFSSLCRPELVCCSDTKGVAQCEDADDLGSHRLSRDPVSHMALLFASLFHHGATASVELSGHNPVKLSMFPCMFNACTRITTHQHMSAFFWCTVFPVSYKLVPSQI